VAVPDELFSFLLFFCYREIDRFLYGALTAHGAISVNPRQYQSAFIRVMVLFEQVR